MHTMYTLRFLFFFFFNQINQNESSLDKYVKAITNYHMIHFYIFVPKYIFVGRQLHLNKPKMSPLLTVFRPLQTID